MKCRPALNLRFYARLADALDPVQRPDASVFLKAPAFEDEHARLMPKEFSRDGETCRTAANDDQIGFELAPVFQARQIQSLQDFALSERAVVLSRNFLESGRASSQLSAQGPPKGVHNYRLLGAFFRWGTSVIDVTAVEVCRIAPCRVARSRAAYPHR